MDQERLHLQCYKMLYEYDSVGRTTWATGIKNILYQTGFGHVWINQGVGETELFLQIFKQWLTDTNQQKWINELQNTSKLDLYITFKSELSLEKYFIMNIPNYNKRLLTKLRCSSLKLEIEHGRHTGVERNLRLCRLCHDNLEDCYHFIMICPK